MKSLLSPYGKTSLNKEYFKETFGNAILDEALYKKNVSEYVTLNVQTSQIYLTEILSN